MNPFEDLEPREIARRMQAREKLTLVDVRERDEWDRCRIEGARLLPLSRIQAWQDSLAPDDGPHVLYCHHGVRSRWACAYLAQRGMKGLVNMSGGIDLWSRSVDPSVPLY